MKITLKAARVNSNYTQEEVAKYLGTSRQSIINYENGKTSPRLEMLLKIATLYRMDLENIELEKPKKKKKK